MLYYCVLDSKHRIVGTYKKLSLVISSLRSTYILRSPRISVDEDKKEIIVRCESGNKDYYTWQLIDTMNTTSKMARLELPPLFNPTIKKE